MKRIRHRKLSTEMVTLFRTEAEKRVAVLSYAELARRSGLAQGTCRQLMSEFMQEEREFRRRARRGANSCSLDELMAELRA